MCKLQKQRQHWGEVTGEKETGTNSDKFSGGKEETTRQGVGSGEGEGISWDERLMRWPDTAGFPLEAPSDQGHEGMLT